MLMVFEEDVAHHGDEPVVVFVEPLRLLIFPERAAVSFFGRHKALKVRTRSLPEFANKFMLEIFRLKNQLTVGCVDDFPVDGGLGLSNGAWIESLLSRDGDDCAVVRNDYRNRRLRGFPWIKKILEVDYGIFGVSAKFDHLLHARHHAGSGEDENRAIAARFTNLAVRQRFVSDVKVRHFELDELPVRSFDLGRVMGIPPVFFPAEMNDVFEVVVSLFDLDAVVFLRRMGGLSTLSIGRLLDCEELLRARAVFQSFFALSRPSLTSSEAIVFCRTARRAIWEATTLLAQNVLALFKTLGQFSASFDDETSGSVVVHKGPISTGFGYFSQED